MRTMKPTTQNHSNVFPCPGCRRIISAHDRFCGFCHFALQKQCSTCGHWAKADHNTQDGHAFCPCCGEAFGEGGLTYDQKQRLSSLKHTEETLHEDLASYHHQMECLVRQRARHRRRLVAASALLGVLGLLALSALVWLWNPVGIVVFLVVLVLFRRPAAALPGAIGRLCCGAVPAPLHAIHALQEDINDVAIEIDLVQIKIEHINDERTSLEEVPETVEEHVEDVGVWKEEEEEVIEAVDKEEVVEEAEEIR